MILTYKIKHGMNFSTELEKARKVALFALKTGSTSSKDVKSIGLKSMIANQILRKYSRNKNIKRISSVKLTIPRQGIKVSKGDRTIDIPCIKTTINYSFPNDFVKVNQVEVGTKYLYVAVTVNEADGINPVNWLGVDLNTTGHCVVAACPSTGKVLKLGKKAHHTHTTYKNFRRRFQKKKKLGLVKKSGGRESRIVRDLNHRMSRKVVDYALENNLGIVMEDLKGIRKSGKSAKSFKYSLNSWSYYQFQQFLEYKAKLLGIPIVKIDPSYTSQQCSKCGLLGNRNKKHFKCPDCGHVEDADVNAAFVIALRHEGILRSIKDRDLLEGSTDTPEEATQLSCATLEPLKF